MEYFCNTCGHIQKAHGEIISTEHNGFCTECNADDWLEIGDPIRHLKEGWVSQVSGFTIADDVNYIEIANFGNFLPNEVIYS